MRDALQDDLRTEPHECGHSLLAILLGRKVLRIIAHRHHALTADERGSVEWLQDKNDPYGEAMILLAGRLAAEGMHPRGDTPDEVEARRVCPLGWQQAHVEAWCLLFKPSSQRALTALCHAVAENGGVLNGIQAEEIVLGGP